jgi:hypothetical protein
MKTIKGNTMKFQKLAVGFTLASSIMLFSGCEEEVSTDDTNNSSIVTLTGKWSNCFNYNGKFTYEELDFNETHVVTIQNEYSDALCTQIITDTTKEHVWVYTTGDEFQLDDGALATPLDLSNNYITLYTIYSIIGNALYLGEEDETHDAMSEEGRFNELNYDEPWKRVSK